MYAFCINPKHPGYFCLMYKQGRSQNIANWPVKVIPDGYELKKNTYPDMQTMKNGFKMMAQTAANAAANGGIRR